MTQEDAADKLPHEIIEEETLTDQQEAFCQEYLIDLNRTQAAIRAGYSAKSAGQQGSALLKNPKISTRIAFLMSERALRTQVTQDRVLTELAAVAFTSFTDLASWNEENLAFVPSHELPEGAKRSVKSVKVKRTVVTGKDDYESVTVETELTQHDKLSALDKLAKHLNLYNEHQQSGQTGLTALVEHMARRKADRDAERSEDT